MPNHFHGILIVNHHKVIESSRSVLRKESVGNLNASIKSIYFSKISPEKGSLGIIIRTFKGAVTKYCNQNGMKNFEWQRNYYEHIIRNETDLFYIRKYIEQNPLKWELDEYYRK